MRERLLVILTLANLGFLLFLLPHVAKPAAADVAPAVLRGKGLEIVDDQGRVRASIALHPAGTAHGQGIRRP
jgi:hypothetical protein